MTNRFSKQYCRALVIVHGASELQIVRSIKSKLRLPLEIYSNEKGASSIQVNGLENVLGNVIFNNPKNFLKQYDNIETYKRAPVNFKVFIIMDTDDCKNDEIREQYIDGSLFSKHWLSPYITPIYNSPSLEDVMINCGFFNKKLSNKDKLPTYRKLFPITQDATNFEEIKALSERLERCKYTNFDDFIKYCLDWAEQSKIK